MTATPTDIPPCQKQNHSVAILYVFTVLTNSLGLQSEKATVTFCVG